MSDAEILLKKLKEHNEKYSKRCGICKHRVITFGESKKCGINSFPSKETATCNNFEPYIFSDKIKQLEEENKRLTDKLEGKDENNPQFMAGYKAGKIYAETYAKINKESF